MAQIVRNTAFARCWHKTLYAADGHKIEEAWQDGKRMRLERHDPSGKLIWEWRYDGSRRLEYVPFDRRDPLKNATHVVRLWKPAPNEPEPGSPNPNYAYLIKDASNKPESVPAHVGGIDRYTIVRDHFGFGNDGWSLHDVKADHMTVDVDPKTQRIVSLQSEQLGTKEVIEFPPTIPEAVFDVARHEVKGVPIHDLDHERRTIAATIHRGLGSRQGVTLRFVAMDAQGELWALWTGTMLSASDPFKPTPWRLVGANARQAFTLDAFTDGWADNPRIHPAIPGLAERLKGTSVYPAGRVGRAVDLEVRAADGRYVRFNHVPVARITWFSDYPAQFGMLKGHEGTMAVASR